MLLSTRRGFEIGFSVSGVFFLEGLGPFKGVTGTYRVFNRVYLKAHGTLGFELYLYNPPNWTHVAYPNYE